MTRAPAYIPDDERPVKKPVLITTSKQPEPPAPPPSTPVDFNELANQIFRSVQEAMSRRCAALEQRIAVLEKDAERRSVTLSQFIRDARGELIASVQEKT